METAASFEARFAPWSYPARTRPTVELRPRLLRVETKSYRCRDSVACITATWSPPERATGGEPPSRSNSRRSPEKIASAIRFRPGQSLPQLHATLSSRELAARAHAITMIGSRQWRGF